MKAKISRMQFFFMIPILLYGKAIGITSGILVRKIGGDTWISMSIGFIIGIFVVMIFAYLGKKFPDKTIIQYSEELLGKWLGKAVGLILTLFFLIAFGTSANTLFHHIKEYFLPSTPYIILCILYVLICMYGVHLGFEVIVRFSLIAFLTTFLLNATTIIGIYKDLNLENLFPIMEQGFLTNLSTSIYVFSDIAMAVLAIGIVLPAVNIKKKTMVLSFFSVLIGALFVIIWPISETAVLGPDIMKKYVVVCMELVRCAQLTKYLPRYEIIMVGLFVFTMYLQSTAMFYCAKYSFKQVTGIKKDWFIIIPFAIIELLITFYMGRDHNNFIGFLASPYALICTILSIGLPILLLAVAIFRGKLKKQEEKGTVIFS